MPNRRKPYPSEMSNDEWSLVLPYLTLMSEDAAQREYSIRELFNGLRYVVRYGIAWRAMPNDLPPWSAVHQQAQRWLAAGCFETLEKDLRALLCLAAGRAAEPSAAIIDSRTLRSTPESGQRAGYDGAKRKCGSKLHLAIDTLGHLLAGGPVATEPKPHFSSRRPRSLGRRALVAFRGQSIVPKGSRPRSATVPERERRP
jgi:transposase